MSFSLRSVLATALALAPVALAGPFTLRYFPSSGCGSGGVGCNGYDSFQCCEAPPSQASFPYARVTSSGPPGFVVFTEVDVYGGCGICESTGAFNTCYENRNPFNTMFAAGISQCQFTGGARTLDGKTLALEGSRVKECKEVVPLDTAEVGGQAYDITGDEKEQVIADVLGLDAEAFHAKWAKLHKGPVLNETLVE